MVLIMPVPGHCFFLPSPGTILLNEPRYEKTGLRGFRPGPTQTRLYSHTRWPEACNFVFRKERDCTMSRKQRG